MRAGSAQRAFGNVDRQSGKKKGGFNAARLTMVRRLSATAVPSSQAARPAVETPKAAERAPGEVGQRDRETVAGRSTSVEAAAERLAPTPLAEEAPAAVPTGRARSDEGARVRRAERVASNQLHGTEEGCVGCVEATERHHANSSFPSSASVVRRPSEESPSTVGWRTSQGSNGSGAGGATGSGGGGRAAVVAIAEGTPSPRSPKLPVNRGLFEL